MAQMVNLNEKVPLCVVNSVFRKFDADGNGVLDRQEFRNLLDHLGKGVVYASTRPKHKREEKGAPVDTKIKTFSRPFSTKHKNITGLTKETEKDALKALADEDGDGKVDYEEFKVKHDTPFHFCKMNMN